jgi:hypothetical protein
MIYRRADHPLTSGSGRFSSFPRLTAVVSQRCALPSIRTHPTRNDRRRWLSARAARNLANSQDSKWGLSLKTDRRYDFVTRHLAYGVRKRRNRKGREKHCSLLSLTKSATSEQRLPNRQAGTIEFCVIDRNARRRHCLRFAVRGNEFFTNSMYLFSFST